jgi:hypothetical protein
MSRCESCRSSLRSRSNWLKSDRLRGKFVRSSMALVLGFWLEKNLSGDFRIEQVEIRVLIPRRG